MESPVEGSSTPGAVGLKSRGRSFRKWPSLAPRVLAEAASRKMRLALLLNSIAGFDIDSTPPAIPTSARPATIESWIAAMAEAPVMQLSVNVSDLTLDLRSVAIPKSVNLAMP